MSYDQLYHLALLLAAISSFVTRRAITGLGVLRLLLVVSLTTEVVTGYFFTEGDFPSWIYNIYVPFECLMLVIYYNRIRRTTSFKRLSLVFLICYLVFILYYLWEDPIRFYQMPRLMYNVSVVIQVVLATIALVFIEPKDDSSILRLPEFWILSAIIIFYTGVFVFNGVAAISDENTYKYLHDLIVKSLNILFYLTLILVFSWKQRTKK